MSNLSLDIGPVKLYIFLLLLWITLASLSPIEFQVDLSASDVFVFVTLNVFLFIGFLFGQRLPVLKRDKCFTSLNNTLVSKRLLPFVFFLGVLGFIIKMYTLFFIKGVPLTFNVVEIRLLLLNDIGAGQGGGFSLIAGLLFPFCMLFIPLYFSISQKNNKEKFFLKIILFLLVVDAFFSGGGTSIVIVFLYCLFSTKGLVLSKYRIFCIIVGVLAIFSLAGYLWLLRLDEMFGGIEPL